MVEGCCSNSNGSIVECQNEKKWDKTLYVWCVCARERDDSGVIWNEVSDVELFGKMVGVLVQDGSVVVDKIDNAPRGGRGGGGNHRDHRDHRASVRGRGDAGNLEL